MNKHHSVRLIACILSLAFLAAMSLGQGFGGAFGGSPYFLLMRKDVQKELKLTDEQLAKLDDARTAMRDSLMQTFQNNQGNQKAIQEAFQKAMEEADKTSKGILKPDQQKRVLQIFVQQQGANSLQNADVQAAVGLSETQIKKIKDLQQANNDANGKLFERMRNGEIDRDAAMADMTKNQNALKAELEKVLGDEQKKKFADLAGPKFEFDPNEKIQFGGRGG